MSLETEPLLLQSTDLREPTLPEDKGKCWCCWELSETTENPLIRVCRGCKDPDLQWIHQQCIDRYISSLPPPRHAPSSGPSSSSSSSSSSSQSPVGEGEHQVFSCTRCKDVYKVDSHRLPLFKALLEEPV